MNADRANSYSQLMERVRDIGPVKLLPAEQDRVRDAADTLVLAPGWDDESREAVQDIEDLVDHLTDTGRWEQEPADRLLDAVTACGPERVAV